MDNIFIVDEPTYRKYLTDFYVWPIDKFEDRTEYVNSKFSKEYLQKIVDDTKKYYYVLLQKLEEEYDRLVEEKKERDKIFDENTVVDKICLQVNIDEMNLISTHVGGGWPADCIYSIENYDETAMISQTILEQHLGVQVRDEREYIEVFNEEEQVGHIEESVFFRIIINQNQLDQLLKNSNFSTLPKEDAERSI